MLLRALVLVGVVVLIVVGIGFGVQTNQAAKLPSAYDTGLTVDAAFQGATKPLLIEFYSDSCHACQIVTPIIHAIYEKAYKDKLTFVMANTDDEKNAPIAELFGIDAIPAIFVFDPRKMKKAEVLVPEVFHASDLEKGLADAFTTVANAKAKAINSANAPKRL